MTVTTVALMWEARAVEGRGAELLEWVRDQQLPGGEHGEYGEHGEHGEHGERGGRREPLRCEIFAAPGDRVLVITWWPGSYDAVFLELPDPPGELVVRPVHRWRFESIESR